MWDINPAVGGPIRADKLWFYSAYRYWGNYLQAGGSYFNKDPLAFTYVPDLNRPAKNETWYQSENLRLTWQASPKNKLAVSYNLQFRCDCYRGIDGSVVSAAGLPTGGLRSRAVSARFWRPKCSKRLA